MIKIAHTSDQQIRMFKRHKEFKDSFQNLYASLREQRPDAIVFAGDFLHEKTHISAELIEMAAHHLKNLSDIAPLFLVPGNHDGNLNNLTRMDSLTPIINAIDSDKIHYLKHSEVCDTGLGFDLVIFSCFDDEGKWPVLQDINPNKINVGIFHGMVQGAVLQNGQIVTECPNKLQQFMNIVDYLMLGDIHKHQFLDVNYRAAYPGSYPQQNYAETVEKGYLIWNIESKKKHTVNFIKLPNVCPFYTIELGGNLAVPLNLQFQKKARIRIVSRSLTSAEKKKIEQDVKFAYEPIDIAFSEPFSAQKQVVIGVDTDVKAENLEDVAVQDKLFKEFFAEYELSENIIKEVLELNKFYDISSKTEEDIKRNIQYKVLKQSWSNLFSYGEDNVLDYTKLQGIVGIFGKNGSGKSSAVVDIPGYTIWNKISKEGVVKNDLIINEEQANGGSEIEIQLDQDRYFITRATQVTPKSKTDPTPQGKTEVDFRVLHPDGTMESKNAEQRQDTDKAIKKVFGTAEDSMATSISPQWQLLGLIKAGGTERQKLIGRYFDIDVFEQKNKLAKEEWKQIKAQMKLYEAKDLQVELEKSKLELGITSLEVNSLKRKSEEMVWGLKQYKEKITKKEKNISKFDDKTKILDLKKRTILDKIALIDKKLGDIKKYPCIANPDCCLLQDIKDNEQKLELLRKDLTECEKAIFDNKFKFNSFQEENKLSEDEKKCQELEDESTALTNTLYQSIRKEAMLEKQIEQIHNDTDAFNKIKHLYQIYDYFILATSKDGISKKIIAKNLHIINSQIKKILSNDVSFELELSSADDGKAVEIFFKHEKNKPRRIELCSGAEKTISAIAIRAALVSMTTLPRSNLFVLDEVFTSLDPEYMDAMVKMLEYLKELFDTVLIITHLDAFKDIVDHSIEIIRDDKGYSRIVS